MSGSVEATTAKPRRLNRRSSNDSRFDPAKSAHRSLLHHDLGSRRWPGQWESVLERCSDCERLAGGGGWRLQGCDQQVAVGGQVMGGKAERAEDQRKGHHDERTNWAAAVLGAAVAGQGPVGDARRDRSGRLHPS
jgi:hypothetical protein